MKVRPIQAFIDTKNSKTTVPASLQLSIKIGILFAIAVVITAIAITIVTETTKKKSEVNKTEGENAYYTTTMSTTPILTYASTTQKIPAITTSITT